MVLFYFSSSPLVKPASNKLGILEEDDEFEEFPVEGKLKLADINNSQSFALFLFLVQIGRTVSLLIKSN